MIDLFISIVTLTVIVVIWIINDDIAMPGQWYHTLQTLAVDACGVMLNQYEYIWQYVEALGELHKIKGLEVMQLLAYNFADVECQS